MTRHPPAPQGADPRHLARQVIAHHSKSFALAARLLPQAVREDAQVLYAFCRRADDAVDDAPAGQQRARLEQVRSELDAVYGDVAVADPLLLALQAMVRRHGVPRRCFDDLLAGMAMDAEGFRYVRMEQLLLYGYRVAGTVGLMMCHVMGVHRPEALRRAAHLGIAMQLTNIARDIAEDWNRGRIYLPAELLARHGMARDALEPGQALPRSLAPRLAGATEELLRLADRYYASGDEGLALLPARCVFGVRAARLIYAEIGAVLRRRGANPLSGRAAVSTLRKVRLVVRAAFETGTNLLRGRLRAALRGTPSPSEG